MQQALIDSHAHLTHDRFLPLGGPDAVLRNARDANVSGILSICCEISKEYDPLLKLCDTYDFLWCTVGTHPHEAGLPDEKRYTTDDIAKLAQRHKKVVGIGETGLDYYYNHSTQDEQIENFRKHIRTALKTDLPLVVHARDADEDIVRILKDEQERGGGSPAKGVIHCFSSSRMLAEEALDLGMYVSFSGILTFKRSEDLREIAKDIPLDRLLVETDAPYLAPEPVRKEINQPARVRYTANVLAEIKGVSPDEIAEQTTENFFRLFSKAKMSRSKNDDEK